MSVARLRFLFLFLGQNGLQDVARLGDVREINLGRNDLRGARHRGAGLARGPQSTLKLRAHLVGLIVFQGTGVGLAAFQAEFLQYVKNLLALDLKLARENVDSNLTHPPLFEL
jgi:hypothetical protein